MGCESARERLEVLAEDLADLALAAMRRAADGDSAALAEERRITRARRAVLKAAALLGDGLDVEP